jgi:hypothetical protein
MADDAEMASLAINIQWRAGGLRCPIDGCGAAVVHRKCKQFRRHWEASHTPECTYWMCSLCGGGFKRRTDIRRHLRIRHQQSETGAETTLAECELKKRRNPSYQDPGFFTFNVQAGRNGSGSVSSLPSHTAPSSAASVPVATVSVAAIDNSVAAIVDAIDNSVNAIDDSVAAIADIYDSVAAIDDAVNSVVDNSDIDNSDSVAIYNFAAAIYASDIDDSVADIYDSVDNSDSVVDNFDSIADIYDSVDNSDSVADNSVADIYDSIADNSDVDNSNVDNSDNSVADIDNASAVVYPEFGRDFDDIAASIDDASVAVDNDNASVAVDNFDDASVAVDYDNSDDASVAVDYIDDASAVAVDDVIYIDDSDDEADIDNSAAIGYISKSLSRRSTSISISESCTIAEAVSLVAIVDVVESVDTFHEFRNAVSSLNARATSPPPASPTEATNCGWECPPFQSPTLPSKRDLNGMQGFMDWASAAFRVLDADRCKIKKWTWQLEKRERKEGSEVLSSEREKRRVAESRTRKLEAELAAIHPCLLALPERLAGMDRKQAPPRDPAELYEKPYKRGAH